MQEDRPQQVEGKFKIPHNSGEALVIPDGSLEGVQHIPLSYDGIIIKGAVVLQEKVIGTFRDKWLAGNNSPRRQQGNLVTCYNKQEYYDKKLP